ncbi:MAG TPA: hypothetical protein VLS96_05425 [Nodosilinea sp.]|nr:hypothetical protein [Nodosilinea sp.]
MGAIAFLALFILGLLLATVGGIIGLVDAFRVSPVWGLLSFFVPFALLVFCIKFWNRKWARNSLIMSLAGLGTMLLSTPFLGAFIAQRAGQVGSSIEETVPTDDPSLESVPIPGTEEPEAEAAGEEFAEPLVPVAPQLSPIARADLIQSTDPNERLQQINNNRTDPFAVVPIPPARPVVPPPPPAGSGPVATAPGAGAASPAAPGGGGGGGGGNAGGGGGAGAGAGGGGSQPSAPGQPTAIPPLAPLPQLPQPTLAEAVLVTGVMTIGNENFAVVQTAAGSQYVRAGQRVANGQVLIKRIDVRGSEPTVVLEQNGIEVSRPVGAAPPTAEAVS